jgi:hypothetical protein
MLSAETERMKHSLPELSFGLTIQELVACQGVGII